MTMMVPSISGFYTVVMENFSHIVDISMLWYFFIGIPVDGRYC